MKAHLLIPSYTGRVHYSILQAMSVATYAHAIHAVTVVPHCSVLPMARARLVRSLLEDADIAVFLDDDTVLEPNDLVDLIDSWHKLRAYDREATALSALVPLRGGREASDYLLPFDVEGLDDQWVGCHHISLAASVVNADHLRFAADVAPEVTYDGEWYPNLFPAYGEAPSGRFIAEDEAFSDRMRRYGKFYADVSLHFGHAAR